MSSYAILLSRASVSNGSNKRATRPSSLAKRFAGLLRNIGRVFIAQQQRHGKIFCFWHLAREYNILAGHRRRNSKLTRRKCMYVSRKKGVAKRGKLELSFSFSFFLFLFFVFWILAYRVIFRIRSFNWATIH